jgi:DNA-binding PadR family transcriptional regulator
MTAYKKFKQWLENFPDVSIYTTTEISVKEIKELVNEITELRERIRIFAEKDSHVEIKIGEFPAGWLWNRG